ncbi:MAG: ATP synthase subunit I [Thermodesulfovibrionales bacterium]
MGSRIYRHSLILVVVAAAVSAFFEWKKMPLGVVAGGVLGLLNHRAMVWGLKGMFKEGSSYLKLLFLSVFRLLVLFVIVLALVMAGIVNIFGVLIGFTAVFTVIVKEGYFAARGEN